MNEPSISVVIPARNREATIRASVESVLRQTLPPAEIIVVDDASDDRTSEAAGTDPLVRVVRLPERSGAQAARNAGIRAAKGEWIAFLDSDDEWLPEKLAKQAEATTDPSIFVYSSGIEIDRARGTRRVIAAPDPGDDAYATFLRGRSPLFPSIFVSKQALEAIGGLDERVASFQEWDTAIRLAKHCRAVAIPEPLFLYHVNAGEAISRDKLRAIEGYEYLLAKFEEEIKTRCGIEVWDEHLLHLAERCLDARSWEAADRHLRRISTRGARFRIVQLCRLLHVSPWPIVRLKKAVFG